MAKNIQKITRRLKARELESRILKDFEQVESKCKDKDDFLEKTKYLLLRMFRADFCFIALKENNRFSVKSVEFPSDNYDAELFSKIAAGLNNNGSMLVINNTRKHIGLKSHGFKSSLGTAIKVGDDIGAVILGFRKKRNFFRLDGWKLMVIKKGFASSLSKIKIKEELKEKNRELEIIGRISSLQETISDYPKLINAILKEIKTEIECEIAFFYLNSEQEQFIIVGKSSESSFVKNNRQTLIKLAAETIDESESNEFGRINSDIQNGLCLPFVTSVESQEGVLGVINAELTDYSRRVLQVVAKQISSAVSEDWEKAQIKNAFGRYVSPEIIETMLKNKEHDYLKTKKDEVTVLFSDVRGFTKLSENFPSEKIVEMLNEHFNVMTEIILRNKGMVDKFIGDAIMAVWGTPVYLESQSFRAVKAAMEMQKAQKELEKKYSKQGIRFTVGIGVNTGEAIIGNVGSELKMDYTVMGDTPNTASRICSAAQGGQILISESTYREARKSIKAVKLKPIEAKNKSAPVQVYEVLSVKE
ncbi:MAG: adenylate/guanylate cyclase domain-containing protein [Candidatus Woesearchaeota archaeon]